VAILAAVLLGHFAAPLGLILLVLLAVAGVVLPWATHRLARAPAADLIAARGALHATLASDVDGLAELVAFGQEDGFRSRMAAHSAALGRQERRLAGLRGAGDAFSLLLAAVAGVAILGLAIPLVTAGRIDGLFLALLPLTAIASFEGVLPLAGALQQRAAGHAAAGRLFEIIDAAPAVHDPPLPLAAPAGHDVEMRGLRFRYGPAEPLVLDGFDLAVPDGGCVALVGPSGAGKSTVLQLLLRFWEPESGEIRVGGRDVRSCGAEDLRRLLGVVPQHPYLFNGTLRDNLLLAKGDATDAQLAVAVRQAQLEPLVDALPRGYDTQVGENGHQLSGGERQRLALARVLLKDAPIVLLDEATANLDELTEARVVRTLEGFLAGRTAVIVSHRPALLRLAGQVITLEPPCSAHPVLFANGTGI
jgi:ABC-type transport system involved in cytochrome bd biosynthesis fused ATPase/permease subunit